MNGEYQYFTTVKDNDTVRGSFNELTQKTFGFDFADWYEAGHWGERYIPHVLLAKGKVISNVSVNLMRFDICGVKKNYIQLGTVMTDKAYRGQGLNRRIMERILQKQEGRADGFYLFANDSVLDYYPKFGFRPAKEYEYYMPCRHETCIKPYMMEKVDITQKEQYGRLCRAIGSCFEDPEQQNQNDAMYMSDNSGLYWFWLATEFCNDIYYLPESDLYVIAGLEGETLHVNQIFGKRLVEMERLAEAFGKAVNEVVLGYTPVCRERFLVREHKEKDCTLFILGEDLQRMERDRMRFPVLSHA